MKAIKTTVGQNYVGESQQMQTSEFFEIQLNWDFHAVWCKTGSCQKNYLRNEITIHLSNFGNVLMNFVESPVPEMIL